VSRCKLSNNTLNLNSGVYCLRFPAIVSGPFPAFLLSILVGMGAVRTCPKCGHRRKSKPKGRVFHCTNKACHFTWHRDGVGAYNIRQKYRGEFGIPYVVAQKAPATDIQYLPHTCVARS
jgi:hypothetical protein